MTAPGWTAPRYLPEGLPLGQVVVDDTWAAVSLPARWGRHVLDVLGAGTGPVFEDTALRLLVWPLPAGGAEDWPDATAASVIRYGPGESLTVPCLEGYHEGTRWLRSPLDGPLFTDPAMLRGAVEFVVGPLEEAAELGQVAVCCYCRTPTRDALLVEYFVSNSGPGAETHACRRCWNSTVGGGDGRHLRAVRRGPR